MTEPATLIFCDFDGTVARRDVGYHLYRHFSGGKNEELIPEWKAGRISSREILTREAAMVNAPAEEIFAFIQDFDLDPGFAEFVRVSEMNGINPVVISEGMDFYIKDILKRNSLDHLQVLSNIGHLDHNRIRIEFPHTNRSCQRCGSCKGERIREFREGLNRPTRVVFVGDGYSDACAAAEADILLAKKDLVIYCRDNNIAFTEFNNFHDVARILVEMGVLKR